MFVIVVTITIILPVSYAPMVTVQRNLTLTVTGRREMNKVRCRACGSARTPSTVTTLQGSRGKQSPMGRKLDSAELNSLATAEAKAVGSVSRPDREARQTRSVRSDLLTGPAEGAGNNTAGQKYELAERRLARGHFHEVIIHFLK